MTPGATGKQRTFLQEVGQSPAERAAPATAPRYDMTSGMDAAMSAHADQVHPVPKKPVAAVAQPDPVHKGSYSYGG